MTKSKAVGGIEPPKRPPSHVKVIKDDEKVKETKVKEEVKEEFPVNGQPFAPDQMLGALHDRPEEVTINDFPGPPDTPEEDIYITAMYEPPQPRPVWPWVLLGAVVLALVGLFLLFWLNPTSFYVRAGHCTEHIVSYPWSTSGRLYCR